MYIYHYNLVILFLQKADQRFLGVVGGMRRISCKVVQAKFLVVIEMLYIKIVMVVNLTKLIKLYI